MKRLVFSSVFEADFAEITAYLAAEAPPEIFLHWEAAIIRLVALLKNFPNWDGCAAICARLGFELLA